MIDIDVEPWMPEQFLGAMAVYSNGSVCIVLPDGTRGVAHNVAVARGLEKMIQNIGRALRKRGFTAEQRELFQQYQNNPDLLREYVQTLTRPTAPPAL